MTRAHSLTSVPMAGRSGRTSTRKSSSAARSTLTQCASCWTPWSSGAVTTRTSAEAFDSASQPRAAVAQRLGPARIAASGCWHRRRKSHRAKFAFIAHNSTAFTAQRGHTALPCRNSWHRSGRGIELFHIHILALQSVTCVACGVRSGVARPTGRQTVSSLTAHGGGAQRGVRSLSYNTHHSAQLVKCL